MQSSTYCAYPYLNNPPCTTATDVDSMYSGARSWHPGGLNTTMADGSVRFVKNSINIFKWRALSTTQGGEVVSADAF
jgi:prepilin-type processing-associated H-X9-DG protein